MNQDITGIIYLVIKIAALFGMGIYVTFAAIIVRQEQLMANVLEEGFEPLLKLIALIHLVAAVGVFFLSIFILP